MNPTSPDLESIDATADLNVQFYAIIGAATSLAADLEAGLFSLYLDASGIDAAEAAKGFYRHVRFTHKRDLADLAVRAVGSDATEAGFDWDETLERLNAIGGDGTARNLIGHNSPKHSITLSVVENTVEVFVQNYVEQNQHLVATQARRPQRETYESLLTYCKAAVVCANRLRYHRHLISVAREQRRAPSAHG